MEFLEKDRDHRRDDTRPNSSGSGDKILVINTIHGRTNQQNSFGYGLCNMKRMGEYLKEIYILKREQVQWRK